MKEEYVCQMPFDVDTANIGLRWWACQALQNFTGNGEGVEWAVNEPLAFDNTDGHMGISSITGVEIPHEKGMYTKKIYRMYNSLPKAVTFFLSKDILTFTEESWLFGYERFSVWVNNYLDKSKFNIFIRFAVAPDNGHNPNYYNLTLEERKQIPQRFINIADKSVHAHNDEDIWNMKSEHFTLPDFSKLDWAESFTPISCLYRIFDINVHYFGLQTLVERMVCNAQYKGTFQLIRQLVTHCDGFYGWSMDQVVERENETKKLLLEKINRPYSEEEKKHMVNVLSE
ncbi:hypothetical protein WA538_001418 [Blastocystis sp. DL]